MKSSPHYLPDVLLAICVISFFGTSLYAQDQPADGLLCNGQCFAVADVGGANGGDDALVTYDTNGVVTLVSPGTGTSQIEAMTLGLDGETMFALNADELGTIDYTGSGTFSAIGAIGMGTGLNESGVVETVTFDDLDGMAFDPLDGRLYATQRWEGQGAAQRPDFLIQINPATGGIVPNAFGPGIDYVVIEPTAPDQRDIDGLAISPIDGRMYGISNEQGPDELIRIDKFTGATMVIGEFFPGEIIDAEGITFNPAGDMTIVTGQRSASVAPNRAFDVDLSTGQATEILAFTNTFAAGADYESSTCLFCPANRIAGTVTIDCDENGVADTGEFPAAGITVTLYRDVNMDGVVDLAAGDILGGTRVTDANGQYEFQIIAAGDFIVQIDPATLPPGSTLTSVDQHVILFPVGVGGLTDDDNDFTASGYPVLDVTKQATPATVMVGDTVTYTVDVENIAPQTLTNIDLTDTLPAGVTLVPGSVMVSAPNQAVFTAEDDFTSLDYAGGTGWTGDWIETGDDGDPTTGAISVSSANQNLFINNVGILTRGVDLSNATAAELRFDVNRGILTAGQSIDVFTDDGSGPVTRFRIIGPIDENTFNPVAIDISGAAGSPIDIGFDVQGFGGAEFVSIDNIVVEGSNRNPATVPGGAPPALATQPDLLPGETMTVTYQVTVDADAVATINNTASANATEACEPAEASATLTVEGAPPPPAGEPGITIAKSVYEGHDGGASCPGSASLTAPTSTPVTYCFTVENTGGVPLTNVVVSDPLIPNFATIAQPGTVIATLATGETVTVFAESTLAAALTNVASVTGEPPEGVPVTTNSPPVVVTPELPPPPPPASISLTKGVFEGHDTVASCLTAGPSLTAPVGSPITYCIFLENTGGVIITNIVVSDSLVPNFANIVQPGPVIASLDPGESATIFVETFLTNALSNVASVDADGPDGPITTNSPPVVVTPLIPAFILTKGVYGGHDAGASCTTAGTSLSSIQSADITYCFVIENTGDLDLSNVVVSDPFIPNFASIAQPATTIATLAVGESATVFAETTLDADLMNVASITGEPPFGGPITTNSPPVTVTPLIPSFSLTKTVVAGHEDGANCSASVSNLEGPADAPITFCFLVENTGTAPLGTVTIADPGVPNFATLVVPSPTISNLAPGATALAYLQTTSVDDLVNTATVTFEPPNGPPIETNSIAAVTVLEPGVQLTTAAVCGQDDGNQCAGATLTTLEARPGDPVTFCYRVTNTGETFLVNLSLTDAAVASAPVTAPGPLAPGESMVLVIPHTVAASLTGNPVLSADSAALDPADPPDESITAGTAGSSVTLTTASPGIRLIKTVYSGHDAGASCGTAPDEAIVLPGTDVTFCFRVENTGDTPLTGIRVRDDAVTPSLNQLLDNLVPGESATLFVETTANDDLVNVASVSSLSAGTCLDPATDSDLAEVDVESAGLGNFVWIDENADGLQDLGEPGVPNVNVTLLDVAGNTLNTTSTDSSGEYAFLNLPLGTYSVQFDLASLPDGFLATVPNASADDRIDSDANPTSGITPPVTLAANAVFNPTLDLGIVLPHELGNLVWLDRDNSGTFDAGESPIPGVLVNLYEDTDGDNELSLGDVFLDNQTTDADGKYLFSDLLPGDYIVQVAAANFLPGAVLAEHFPSDSVTEPDTDIDNDNNGQPGAPATPGANSIVAQAVTLTYQSEPINETETNGSDPQSNLSVDFGFYTLVRIGNLVWHDINNNGLVDSGEPGIDGVRVELFPFLGEFVDEPTEEGYVMPPFMTTVTTNGGQYSFNDLQPGLYAVEIPIPPAGLPLSSETAIAPDFLDATTFRDDQIDNDDNGFQFRDSLATFSDFITLWSQDEPTNDGDDNNGDLTIDFGFHAGVSIGDVVWLDENADGLQSVGEPGVPDVTVILTSPGSSTVLATTTTDADGGYLFTNLPPAEYQITFDLATIPAEHIVTLRDAGDDALDSDADPDTGVTPPVNLPSSGDQDLTIDMGLIKLARLSGTVWNDIDRNAATNENLAVFGFGGVEVDLFRIEGGTTSLVQTVTTANTPDMSLGTYSIEEIPPGQYLVAVRTNNIPEIFLISPGSTPLEYALEILPCDDIPFINFGFNPPPTAITLASFTAQLPADTAVGDAVTIRWTTASEENTLGFNLHRVNLDGSRSPVNDAVILAIGGGTYDVTDAEPGALFYELEELTTDLATELAGTAGLSRPAPPTGENVHMIPAEDDAFQATVPDGIDTVLAHGFAAPPLVFDITDPNRPVRLEGVELEDSAVYFSAPAGTQLLLLPPGK